jgi:lipopolysaccharide/colanic/teichoic acid biosynthesis glycosyltransferase
MRPVDRLWLGRKLAWVGGDIIVFFAVLALTFYVRDPAWLSRGLVVPFLPVLCFCVVTAYAAGLYDLHVIRDFVALIGGLLGSSVGCWVFGTTYFYVMSPQLRFSPKITLVVIVVVAHVGMLAWRRAVLSTTGSRLVDLKILVLGEKEYQDALREDYDLVDRVEADLNLVVVDRRWMNRHHDEARAVLAAAIAKLIPIVNIDEFHESLSGKVSPQHANDLVWALDHVLPRAGSLHFKIKRALDAIVAAALLVILAPVMLLVGAVIGLVDHTPPLYGQMRIGYLGRTFRLWKFRTMLEDAEQEGPFTRFPADDDPRVTRLGYLLRRLRIDELPQFWNVLKGDMSLVGPRPEWAREVDILEKAVPTYTLRYLVPPGLTGWAQVYFRATNTPHDSIEKHNYDLYYLKHFSLALDLSIMLKTIKRVFVHDSRVLTVPALQTSVQSSDADIMLDVASIVGRG